MDIDQITKELEKDSSYSKGNYRKKSKGSSLNNFIGGGSMFDFEDVVGTLDDSSKDVIGTGIKAMVTTGLILGGATLLAAGLSSVRSFFNKSEPVTVILDDEDELDPENGEEEDK